jgi:dipeptidase
MPLWIKPDKKLSVHDIMELMRDYYQDTPMDMSKDIGAGPFGSTMRARPMTWEVNGESYFNERAISTQQTGFSFVAQCREWLPDPVGGILWFGVDDTYYTAYTPMYCGMTEVPESFAVGTGDMMDFTNDAAFWVFNQVSNYAYNKRSLVEEDIKTIQSKLELGYIEETQEIDKIASKIHQEDPELAVRYITDYSVMAGNKTTDIWRQFYGYLFAKYLDGNKKEKQEIPEGYNRVNAKVEYVGYPAEWYEKIVKETGDKFKQK